MYSGVTTAFHNACKATTRDIYTKCEVINGNSTITMYGAGSSGEIISMEWDNVASSQEGFQIGTFCMDEFKMKYHPITTTISLLNKEIHPYIGVDVNGTVTYVPLGIFYVTNVETEDDDKTFSITAYDGAIKFAGKFYAGDIGVTFPISAWNLLMAIVHHFGFAVVYEEYVNTLKTSDSYILYSSDARLLVHQNVTANKNVIINEPFEGTYRDYVGWIAGLLGRVAHFDREGNVFIRRYLSTGFTIGRDVQHLGGARINYNGAVTYTSIISGTAENPVYPTAYSGNAISYTNPYITPEELDLVCEQVVGENGLTITPCEVTWRGDPALDVADIINVKDKDNNNTTVYVMERVVTITGGMTEVLHCYGRTETMQNLDQAPSTSQLIQVSQEFRNLADLVNNTKGTFKFIENTNGTNGGFVIYEDESSSWLRCTAGGLGISADGGLTYTNAITKNGVVASQLSVYKSGEEILGVKYLDYASRSELSMSNVGDYYPSVFISAGRNGSDNGGFGGITLQDPRQNGSGSIQIDLSYPDATSECSRSSITMYSNRPSSNYNRIILNVADTTSRSFAEIGIRDISTGEEMIGMEDSNGTPQMYVKSGNTFRVLTLKHVSIGGTYYYFLGEQA